MTRKKILLVIVEGPSDETALGYALSQVYDREQVYIQVVHGDITTKGNASFTNIVTMVGNAQKRETLFRLIGTGRMRTIPYKVYYMSCNMDHVLYDKRNSSDEEKRTTETAEGKE